MVAKLLSEIKDIRCFPNADKLSNFAGIASAGKVMTNSQNSEIEGYMEQYNPISTFIVRTDEIAGLSAEEIAEKLALSKVPNKIVEVELPPSIQLEVSIVGPQPDWGTIGGNV